MPAREKGLVLLTCVAMFLIAEFAMDARLLQTDTVIQDGLRLSLVALLGLLAVHATRNGGLGG